MLDLNLGVSLQIIDCGTVADGYSIEVQITKNGCLFRENCWAKKNRIIYSIEFVYFSAKKL